MALLPGCQFTDSVVSCHVLETENSDTLSGGGMEGAETSTENASRENSFVLSFEGSNRLLITHRLSTCQQLNPARKVFSEEDQLNYPSDNLYHFHNQPLPPHWIRPHLDPPSCLLRVLVFVRDFWISWKLRSNSSESTRDRRLPSNACTGSRNLWDSLVVGRAFDFSSNPELLITDRKSSE